jgi:hypothetical protein
VPSQILRFMLCCIVSFTLLLAPTRGEEGHSNIHCVEAAGLPNSPIRLGIHVGPSVKVDEALVVLHDIPAEAKFNIGLDVGAGAWLVPVYALPDLTITMPHRGHVRMTAQLFDAQFTPNSQKVPVHVHIETTTATVGN